jgi:transcriptional regulator with XRE-family HTH domain
VPRHKSTHVDSAGAVGQRIREARERRGLRQRDLAFEGCSAAYVSRIEAGERIPSLQLNLAHEGLLNYRAEMDQRARAAVDAY